MITPEEAIRNFKKAPFTLWELKGKEFTIIENLSTKTPMRETKEKNKWDNVQDFFFINIECGLFQKDLKMTEREMLTLFCCIPESITNYRGSMISVHPINRLEYKYIGSTNQDINGNRLDGAQSAPISQPQQPIADQKDLFANKLASMIKLSEDMGMATSAAVVIKMAEKITPGDALGLITYAKTKGVITEKDGVYKAVD